MKDLFTKKVTIALIMSSDDGAMEWTGRDAYCEKVDISTPFPSDRQPLLMNGSRVVLWQPEDCTTVTMTFRVPTEKMSVIWDAKPLQHISNKKVDDCTVQELLFAVRTKLNKED